MSIPLIYAENMMNSPEAVITNRKTQTLDFTGRDFKAPYLSPSLAVPVTMSVFEKGIKHLMGYNAEPYFSSGQYALMLCAYFVDPVGS